MGEFRYNDGVLVGDFVVPQLMAAIEVHVGGSGLVVYIVRASCRVRV